MARRARPIDEPQVGAECYAFGVDGARPDIIRKVGSLKAFMAESGVSAGPALASIMESVGQTVVQSVTGDGRKLVLPPPPRELLTSIRSIST